MRKRLPGDVGSVMQAVRLRAACTALVVLSCILLIRALPAAAHHPGGEGRADGIPIAGLTHGQMAVLVDYRRAILNLAGRRRHADPAFRRLQNYAAIQYAYCFWGVMPGSIADEESPFNECAHAYLAATHALLLSMLAGSPDDEAVQDLARRIEAEMLGNQAALSLCRNSGEDFNTAMIIRPSLGDMLSHAPTLAVLIGFALAAMGGVQLLRRR